MFLSSPISFLLSSLGNKGVTLQMKIYKLFEEHELCRHLHELGNNEKNNEVLSFLNKKGCSPLYIDHYENFDWNARNHWELVKVKIYRSIKKTWHFLIVFKESLNTVNELLMVIIIRYCFAKQTLQKTIKADTSIICQRYGNKWSFFFISCLICMNTELQYCIEPSKS